MQRCGPISGQPQNTFYEKGDQTDQTILYSGFTGIPVSRMHER
jgi:hypothetical protein